MPDMMKVFSVIGGSRTRCGLGVNIVSGLAMAAAGLSWIGTGAARVAAQGSNNACALLSASDVQPLAVNATVREGVSTSADAAAFSICRYTWGAGADRVDVDVTLNDASRMFSGMSPDQIKQGLQSSVRPGTADAVVSDVGELAVFKADSPAYAHAAAYLKGRLLQVHLTGVYAPDRKDQIIGLLKSAASKL
jgi:hypothetical protein